MSIKTFAALAFLAGTWAQATPGMAQPDFGSHEVFDTRFGQLQVVGEARVAQRVMLNGQMLPLPEMPVWTIMGAWALADAPQDWVLVDWHHGGNSCGGEIVILQVGSGFVTAAPGIDACAGRILDIRVLDGAFEIDQSNPDLAISHDTYRWDGRQITRTAQAAPQVAPAGAGADVTRWAGQHPYRPFDDPREQARFATIMPADQVTRLFGLIGPAHNAVQWGDWVFGAGCQPHNCNGAGGRWGMRISDGAVVAAIVERGRPPQLYGALAQSPEFQRFLAETPL